MNKIKKEFDLNSFLLDNKFYLISFLFYAAGLLGGALIFKNLEISVIKSTTDAIAELESDNFLQLFLAKALVCVTVLSVSMFLGMSLIGYFLVNFVPLFYGFETAIRLSYYYTMYNTKGIGYALLLIIPQTAALILIVTIASKPIGEMSKKILSTVFKNADYDENITVGEFCKKMTILYVSAIAVSAISSLTIYLLSPLISI